MASVSSSSTYRTDLYRSSSNASIPSPPSYVTREPYAADVNYQSRDYGFPSSSSSSRTNYSPTMDHQQGLSRNSRDDYHSSHRDRPNLKQYVCQIV
jgi:hypothetical protein